MLISVDEAMDDDGEPEFIDLAELGNKVTQRSPESSAEAITAGGTEEEEEAEDSEMEDGEVWICRFCDRAFDSELELTSHEKQHG